MITPPKFYMYNQTLMFHIRSTNRRLLWRTLQLKPRFTRFNSITSKTALSQGQDELIEDDEMDVVAPDLENLPSRWLKLKQDDQYEIIDYLKDQQELNWRSDLTPEEKRLAYYLAYGEWGPRDKTPLSMPEFIFRLMSTSLLFMVSGFSLINYFNDKEKLKSLEEAKA